MERQITEYEIRYLLDHLAPMYTGVNLCDFLVTFEADAVAGRVARPEADGPLIHVPASSHPLIPEKAFKIGEIPVLFPCSQTTRWYSMDGNSIRFEHDILKSAFYLLSGYQEYHCDEGDEYGRFPWEASIQYKLGFTAIPVVNYYFELILEAFELFCDKNGLAFRKVERKAPVLFLSHDVDRIQKYSLRNMVYVGLQLPGIISSGNRLAKRFRNVVDYTSGFFLQKKDPYWSFSSLMEMEDQLGISSSWYFLEKTGKNNSRYRFSDTRIRGLIGQLSASGHEIGIHGTMESSENYERLAAEIKRLSKVCEEDVTGIRQHFLKYKPALTPHIQEKAGLLYDATLGFAGQIGFRNSYAGPFRLYDFEKLSPMEVWQIPLNVMDVTLLNYMNLPPEAIAEAVRPVMDEVARFKGVFALLWHNCNLDEEEFPGINEAYHNLLKALLDMKFESRKGRDIIQELKSAGA